MHRLLEQMIVCVNFQGLLEDDIKNVVKKTRELFVNDGFNIQEEYRPTPDQKVVKLYTYEKENTQIILTKDSLEVVVNAMEKYEGFEVYKKYVTRILDNLNGVAGNMSTIVRIGVRKINMMFLRNVDIINNYFISDIFNVSKTNLALGDNGGKIITSGSRVSLASDTHKANIITDIQIGEGKIVSDGKEEHTDLYRTILDIDAYWDTSLPLYKNVGDELSMLSKRTTEIYHDCLNEEFNVALMDEKVNDENIVGGIKA